MRNVHIDALRGYCLVVMMIDHLRFQGLVRFTYGSYTASLTRQTASFLSRLWLRPGIIPAWRKAWVGARRRCAPSGEHDSFISPTFCLRQAGYPRRDVRDFIRPRIPRSLALAPGIGLSSQSQLMARRILLRHSAALRRHDVARAPDASVLSWARNGLDGHPQRNRVVVDSTQEWSLLRGSRLWVCGTQSVFRVGNFYSSLASRWVALSVAKGYLNGSSQVGVGV